jgi:hypothetical protein
MNVVNPDIPLLVVGLFVAVVAGARWHRQTACQLWFCISTFQAQYSWLVSWSLAKACGVFLAADGIGHRPRGLLPFLPFFGYVLASTGVAALFWNIPDDVAFFYGTGRSMVSLLTFGLAALSTMSLATALSTTGGTRLFWVTLRWLGVVHGTASMYQYAALSLGWPLIGISRPHDLTLEHNVPDLAMFVSRTGGEVFRAGALAGEPKAAAALFGTVLFCVLQVGYRLDQSRSDRMLSTCAAALSLFGFLGCFSTSGIAGLALALICAPLTSYRRQLFALGLAGCGVVLMTSGAAVWLGWSSGDVLSVLSERTIERFQEEWDPPVQAALNAMSTSMPVAIFGVGEGGSTFHVMRYLNQSFEYAYAPNIGLIRLAVENGLIGATLFFGAWGVMLRRALGRMRMDPSPDRSLFLAAALSGMSLSMTGSGVPLGVPMSIAALYAAQVAKRRLTPARPTPGRACSTDRGRIRCLGQFPQRS